MTRNTMATPQREGRMERMRMKLLIMAKIATEFWAWCGSGGKIWHGVLAQLVVYIHTGLVRLLVIEEGIYKFNITPYTDAIIDFIAVTLFLCDCRSSCVPLRFHAISKICHIFTIIIVH